MAVQYWVGSFFIDLSRNQVTKDEHSQTIAPKALAVLTYLAENQGKVVSQDALLTEVWQDTAVSPNTLQRSIALLRKAFGDDGKVYIKTHAKQGYSLECNVRWHSETHSTTPDSPSEVVVEVFNDEAPNDSETDIAIKSEPARLGFRLSALLTSGVILAIVILGVIFQGIFGFSSTSSNQSSQFAIKDIRTLTATDNKEFATIYSPDGLYVVFHRYSEETCMNNIWAKDLRTQEEVQLTESLGAYGSHSFTEDGKRLAFIRSEDCSEPITQKKCYQLMSLDFTQALKAPQKPRMLLECKNSEIINPVWLNNDSIVLMQRTSWQHWKLIRFSISQNSTETIYTVDDGNLISYDYSHEKGLFALTSVHGDGHYYIEMFKPDEGVISSHRIKYLSEIANFRYIYPNFSPFDNQLVFSTGRQVFSLTTNGEVTKISLPLDQPMGSPLFHPDGRRMLAIKGHYDSDIASLPLSRINSIQTESSLEDLSGDYSVMERSILGEDNALFQPGGELIAYSSERSGEEQVWIFDGNRSRQLTSLPMDSRILGMDWSSDGQSILVNNHGELIQVFLDGSEKPFALEKPVDRLFHWDSSKQNVLSIIRDNGILKFAEVNLTTSDIRIINDKRINWAVKSDSGQIIYTDQLDRFWQPGPAEDQLIEGLEEQGSDRRYIIKDDVIYGINEEFQLWSYDLANETFKLIGDIGNNVDYLTDINQDDLLLTTRVSARKDVVELTLSD